MDAAALRHSTIPFVRETFRLSRLFIDASGLIIRIGCDTGKRLAADFCINHYKKPKEIAIVIRRITCLEFKIFLTDHRILKRNRLMTIAISIDN